MPCAAIGSVRVVATVRRGFSDEAGSWNTNCKRLRIGRISRAGETGELPPVEVHLTSGRFDEAQHRASQRRLAAARFPYERQDLPPVDVQIHSVHRPHVPHRALEQALPDGEVHFQPLESEQLRRTGLRPAIRARWVRAAARTAIAQIVVRVWRRRRLRESIGRRGRPRCAVRGRMVAGGAGEVLRHGREELARVGVRGVFEHLLQRAGLDDPALAHDRHPVRDLRDHAEVVGDEEQAHSAPALELLHQVQDLGLHRHVQGRGRLVRDQQHGPAGDRHRDHHPLALPAGEAVGILVHPQFRPLDSDLRKRLDGLAAGLLVAEPRAREPNRLYDLVADREHRVQRGHGLLEDHRDVPAAHPHQLFLGQTQQVARRRVGPRIEAEQHLSVAAFGEVARQQPDHRQGGNGLAAARLANEAERLARRDVEARPVHRPHRLPAGSEPGMQVPHLEQRLRATSRAWTHRGTIIVVVAPGVRASLPGKPRVRTLVRPRFAGPMHSLPCPSFTWAPSPARGRGRWRRAAPLQSGCRRTR